MANKSKVNKFSLIDLCIAIILLGLCFFIVLGIAQKVGKALNRQNIQVVFFVEQDAAHKTSNVKLGDKVYDEQSMTLLGTITDIEETQAFVSKADEFGILRESAKEDYFTLFFVVSAKGEILPNAIHISGVSFEIGKKFPVIAGSSLLYPNVYDVKEALNSSVSADSD